MSFVWMHRYMTYDIKTTIEHLCSVISNPNQVVYKSFMNLIKSVTINSPDFSIYFILKTRFRTPYQSKYLTSKVNFNDS